MKKDKAIILLIILGLSLLGLLIFNLQFVNVAQPPGIMTLTFVDVGYDYRVREITPDADPVVYLSEGQLTFPEGTEISISVSESINYEVIGYLINGNKTMKDILFRRTVNGNATIEAIMAETRYKKAIDKFRANNLTVVRIESLYRCGGFSHSLTEFRISSLDGFIDACKGKGIETPYHLRGRLFSQGWRWDKWDYFLFIEGDNLQYFKQDI